MYPPSAARTHAPRRSASGSVASTSALPFAAASSTAIAIDAGSSGLADATVENRPPSGSHCRSTNR
jgi:hypothetical protein